MDHANQSQSAQQKDAAQESGITDAAVQVQQPKPLENFLKTRFVG
jgi:hypothetical protein